MQEYYREDDSIESTEMDEEVSNAISTLLNAVRSKEQIELQNRNEFLSGQLEIANLKIESLKNEISTLENKVVQNDKIKKEQELGASIVSKFASKVDSKTKMENILDCMYTPTFEQVHLNIDAPLWISVVTRYYNDRLEVLDIIRYFNWGQLPKKVENFILPLDWNDKQLESWMKHMSRNTVCNGQLYDWCNIKWWCGFALEDITTWYEKHRNEYSEVPFQYVFMNPLMKTEKYLKMLAIEIAGYHSELIDGIESMQLSEDEIGFIIKCSLSYLEEHHKPISESHKKFQEWLWQNINLIYNHDVTKYLYEKYANSFTNIKQLLKLPTFFVVEHVQRYPQCLGNLLISEKLSAHDKKTLCECAADYYDNLKQKGEV